MPPSESETQEIVLIPGAEGGPEENILGPLPQKTNQMGASCPSKSREGVIFINKR